MADRLGAAGSRAFDHVGVNVPDLDTAVNFFQTVFGARVIFRLPRPEGAGDTGATRLGAPADAAFALAMISIGSAAIELVEWSLPAAASGPAADPWSPGGCHIAVAVGNVAETLAAVRLADGVRVLSGPLTFESGPTPGVTNAFIMTPWGALVELISWPENPVAEAPLNQARSSQLANGG